MRKTNKETILFKLLCLFMTFLDWVWGKYRKDSNGWIYLTIEETTIALIPATQSFSFLNYRGSVFTKEKRYIKPTEKFLLEKLPGHFHFDNNLRNIWIIVDDKTQTVQLVAHDISRGFYNAGFDHEDDIHHLIVADSRTKDSVIQKFYFPILVS